MSQPFPTGPGTAPPGGGPAPGAFAAPPYAQPPQKSKWWVWLLGGCGCSAVLLVLCCGGLSVWTVSSGGKLVGSAIKEQLVAEVADNDDVAEHLGEIQSVSMDFMATGQESQKRGPGGNWIVLNAEGDKGKGTFIVQANNDPQADEKFTHIDLRLPDGKTIQIKPPPEQ